MSIDLSSADTAIVRIDGELDLAAADLVGNALQMVDRSRYQKVRLDLSGVSFCDCAGLGALIAGDAQLRAAGQHLTLADPSDAVRRILRLTSLDTVLDVY